MTIWPGRTQRSIASSFAAASVSGNRTLRSVAPSGRRVLHSVASVRRRVLHSVAAPVSAVTPTPLSPRAKENLPSLMLPDQLKKWEAITVEKPPISRSVVRRLLCATYARCAVRVPHGGG